MIMTRDELNVLFKSKYSPDSYKRLIKSLFPFCEIFSTPVEKGLSASRKEIASSIAQTGACLLGDKSKIAFFQVRRGVVDIVIVTQIEHGPAFGIGGESGRSGERKGSNQEKPGEPESRGNPKTPPGEFLASSPPARNEEPHRSNF